LVVGDVVGLAVGETVGVVLGDVDGLLVVGVVGLIVGDVEGLYKQAHSSLLAYR